MAPFVKIFGSALEAAAVAGDVARHFAWYLSYQMRDSSR
jgi:hypothetical protein